jgi:PKD repeat protein/KaiC/GvpD/RAD55 family RecA-like ATPase
LLVFAEAPSFARFLSDVDPSGWFYQAVLYNPTNEDITVTGLRWWYNSTRNLIEFLRTAKCYDSRYFSDLPSASGASNQAPSWAKWEYPAGSISLVVPAKEIVVTWIEVPVGSNNNFESRSATYNVEAYDGSRWISSPIYDTHGGSDSSIHTVFRADFNLATDPDDENQVHPNPEWLFMEDRRVNPGATTRVRLIPIASGMSQGIEFATINITLPSGWSYVSGSAYNPYDETITYHLVDGKDRLEWELSNEVFNYFLDSSMSQNYIEFNVTAPSTSGVYNFTINSLVTSMNGLTTWENQFIYVSVNTPPKASFTYFPEKPRVNESVTFNASASYDIDGTIVSYRWDFGDGNITTTSSSSITHVYTMPGTYTVNLTVTDNDNLSDSSQALVTVENYPIARFTFSPQNPLTSEIVTFNATASYDIDGQIVSYLWDFGDGNIGTGEITTHAYADNGTYTVTLTITDNDGLEDTAQGMVTVQNRQPVAMFTESVTTVYTGETIYFNASESYDPDGYIANYLWDFGDGTNGIGVTVAHEYAEDGNYTVRLTVIDDDGGSAIATDVKTVLNRAPVASFVIIPQQPVAGGTTIFNASDSYDLDGEIISYQWDFGDNNVTIVSSPTVIHKYASFGNYTVTLTIVDNDGSYDSSTLTLTVHNIDVAIVDVTVSTNEVYFGQTVDITVVVKNEGTINTAFEVTIYANNTAIGVLTINDLQPNQTKNLVFAWNTSNLTESGTYTVKAEIGEISGETDVTDNVNEGIHVTVYPRSLNLWDKLDSYSIPISLGLVFLLSTIAGAILIKRNKQTAALKTLPPQDLGIFDALAGGDIPGVSVMIVGDAGSGKSVLCQQLVNTYLKQGKPCVYITYDCFPNEIRENMKALGWDTSGYEQNETFLFIDCYSSIAGVTSQEKHSVKQPFALSELGIAMSAAMESLKQKSARIFLDSTVPLFTRLDPAKVVQFLQDRSAQIKGENGVFLFTIGKETVEHGLMRRLEEIVDCIIELEVHEERGEPKRKMRIKKLRGRNVINEWISFKIEQKKGFVLFIPKKWARGKTNQK